MQETPYSFCCPADAEFVRFAADCIEDIARCGVDMIVFNDDLRFSYLSVHLTCLCDHHIELLCHAVGEKLTREELADKILSGGENRYRDAYLALNQTVLTNFAKTMRERVDRVDPTIRMGFCAGMSSWDIDGDAYTLAKAFAGSTRPFVRLLGAPYWAVKRSWGNRLQDVIELTRMEAEYFPCGEVELISEGDVWPRPRSQCPATFLEGYDTALRATQRLDGILKIALDYTAHPDYESGYTRLHVRNKSLHARIETAFAGKKSVGLRVYEYPKKVRTMQNPNELGERYRPDNLFFSEAARLVAGQGVPTVYEGDDCCGIAFGENARQLPRETLKNGMILDAAAAKILMDRGIDVGIISFGAPRTLLSERFLENGNRIIAFNTLSYEIVLKPSAKVLSVGLDKTGEAPLSFVYQNSNGERFLVLNISPRGNDTLTAHYARGQQIRDFVGKSFPALCTGHPDLYVLCSEGGRGLAVGLWNFSADPAFEPSVKLGRHYDTIEWIDGGGRLCGDTVLLDEIPAHGYAGFVVSIK